MFIQFALIVSVLFQFWAFIITISLIKKTKFNISWIAISIGFFLMAIRRLIEFFNFIRLDQVDNQAVINSWIAVLVSVLMFISSFYIRQIFKLQDKLNKLTKENEAEVLSAIIKTEERERQKFSKELHDGLGPILSSIKMAISAINKSEVGEKNNQIIYKTENAVDNAITSIKEISNNLSSKVLERFGLEKAIKTFIDSIVIKEGFKFNLDFNLEKVRYKNNIEINLYRIVGELVANTMQHASATLVEISLIEYNNNLELTYTDNGIGFNIQNITNGMGLSNINSRIKSLNGFIEMKSKPKQGIFLKIKLPV